MIYPEALLFIALCTALAVGRSSFRTAAVIVANYGFSVVFHDDLRLVAISDLVAASFLVGKPRDHVVAGLFSVMALVFLAGDLLHWPMNATYGIVEFLGYVQAGVIGGVDNGIHRASRYLRGRLHSSRRSAPVASRPAMVLKKEWRR